MKATRTINDGSILTVTTDNGRYDARVSSDIHNIGFEGDYGEVKEGESAETIADELAMWMNDNLNE